jgi:hypothetical protein
LFIVALPHNKQAGALADFDRNQVLCIAIIDIALQHRPPETSPRGISAAGTLLDIGIGEQSMSQSGDFEGPASARDLAIKSLGEAHEAFDCCFESVRQTQDVLGQSTDALAACATVVSERALQCAEQQLYASFELARHLVQAQDLNEALAIQIAFARQHVQTCTQQAQELLHLVTQYTQRTPRIDYDTDGL